MLRKALLAVMLMLSLSIWVQAQAAVTIGVSFNEAVGAYLTDDAGNTLYVFTQDSANSSNCADSCAQNWPPVIVPNADAVSGIQGLAGELGTFARADNGSLQVTYNRQPLYTFAGDSAPGETNGEAVGGVWYVARPQIVSMGAVEELGGVLVDGQGRTLYTFTNDSDGVSNCSGDCLQNWPALLISRDGELVAGLGAVQQDSLDVITRADTGALQVTYNGMPLYTFAGDSEPGQANGEGVGGVWSVVKPPVLKVGQNPNFGDILVGSDGLTLYTFANDPDFETTCVDQCAANWPPLTVAIRTDLATVDAETIPGDVSYITRPDGSTQVTYDGAPLYTFIGDGVPGATNGHNRNEAWFVVPLSGGSGPLFVCTVTPSNNVNLRGGPGTNYAQVDIFAGGSTRYVIGQAQGSDGFLWWQLEGEVWVRSDIVQVDGTCDNVPSVIAPDAPAAAPAAVPDPEPDPEPDDDDPPPPETTEEPPLGNDGGNPPPPETTEEV